MERINILRVIQYEFDQIKKYTNGDKQSNDQSIDQPMKK